MSWLSCDHSSRAAKILDGVEAGHGRQSVTGVHVHDVA